jgi:hypothetical protein
MLAMLMAVEHEAIHLLATDVDGALMIAAQTTPGVHPKPKAARVLKIRELKVRRLACLQLAWLCKARECRMEAPPPPCWVQLL